MRVRPPIQRIAGWAGIDRNPLRRGIDRVERAIWIILALAFIACVPLLVPMVGRIARADSLVQVRQESSWRQVNAVLLRHAPNEVYGYNTTGTVWVSGRWRAPSGAVRSGTVPTSVGAPAGTVVKVWVDKAGHLTGGRPLSAGDVGEQVLGIEVLLVIGLAVAAVALGGLARWLANRRRLAYWHTEWACFGPRWSTRR
jgi:hypothetical protein